MLPLITPDSPQFLRLMQRGLALAPEIERQAREIVEAVRQRGDDAVRDYTRRFDGVDVAEMLVPESRLHGALEEMDAGFRAVIERAERNIRRFHEHQRWESWSVDDGDGVTLGQRVVPVERAGLYVPGGKAFYPSSLLMNAVPAQVAGVREIVVVSPPGKDGQPSSLVLAVAALLGLSRVYAVGGAQAIAALAYGTATIPRVDKIAGPGNAYVASAKKAVFGDVSIDSVAGPSEIVVLADDTANPRFVAADLLSQAEHDELASAILVTPGRELAEAVQNAVLEMVRELPRRKIAEASLRDYGACIVVADLKEAVDVVNRLAPEHLEIMTGEPREVLPDIKHAGAIFLGPYSSEPVGDYFAGPNHVLPTSGTARFASPLGVEDFLRRQSVISYSKSRLEKTGADIIRFAEEEQLHAHANAIRVRLEEDPSPSNE